MERGGVRAGLAFVLLVMAVAVKETSAEFIYGKEAQKLCRAYRKVCPRSKVCAIQILDISGKTIKFPVCVHQFEVKVRSPICQEAPIPGRCGAQFRRWYFNVHMAACSWFTYSGCGGNDNNFRSREECETMCVVRKDEEGVGATRRPDPLHLSHLAGGPAQHHHRDHEDRGGVREEEETTATNPDSFSQSYGEHGDPYDGRQRQTERQRHEDEQPDSVTPKMQPNGKNRYEEITFDNNGTPYRHTSLAPADMGNGQELSTSGPPLELRGPSLENYRPIVQKPRPMYHHQDNENGNAPAALHTQHEGRWTELSHRTQGLPDSSHGKAESPDWRIAADFSDKARPPRGREDEDGEKPQEELTRPPERNLVRPFPPNRTPQRVLSLLSRDSHGNNSPGLVPDRSDVRAEELTSTLSSSYAPDANETVRRFPSRRRQGRRGKGRNRLHKRRHSRRRRRRNRRRGRRYRRRQGAKKNWRSEVTSWNSVPENKALSMRDAASRGQPGGREALSGGPPSQLAEFRGQSTAYFWPAGPQHREDNQQAAAEVRAGETRRRKKWRKRKGQKKRRTRGRELTTAENSADMSSVAGAQDSQYYERIHLFRLLGPAQNVTESPW